MRKNLCHFSRCFSIIRCNILQGCSCRYHFHFSTHFAMNLSTRPILFSSSKELLDRVACHLWTILYRLDCDLWSSTNLCHDIFCSETILYRHLRWEEWFRFLLKLRTEYCPLTLFLRHLLFWWLIWLRTVRESCFRIDIHFFQRKYCLLIAD